MAPHASSVAMTAPYTASQHHTASQPHSSAPPPPPGTMLAAHSSSRAPLFAMLPAAAFAAATPSSSSETRMGDPRSTAALAAAASPLLATQASPASAAASASAAAAAAALLAQTPHAPRTTPNTNAMLGRDALLAPQRSPTAPLLAAPTLDRSASLSSHSVSQDSPRGSVASSHDIASHSGAQASAADSSSLFLFGAASPALHSRPSPFHRASFSNTTGASAAGASAGAGVPGASGLLAGTTGNVASTTMHVPVPPAYPPQYANVLRGKHVRGFPQHFNVKDQSNYLTVSPNGLGVVYDGPGSNDAHAGTVRTDNPIPRQCGVYYFEVTVKHRGRNGYIGIGFCAQSTPLDKLPGWEKFSWGYHGDDGQAFACSGVGRPYGPTFTANDTIGCIVNFFNNTASFTKNGLYLGVAFRNISDDIKRSASLYPAVGLRTVGEEITANFGEEKFCFDFQHHFEEEQMKLWIAIENTPLVSRPTDTTLPAVGSSADALGSTADGEQGSSNAKGKANKSTTGGEPSMKDGGRTVSAGSAGSQLSSSESQSEQLQQQNKIVHGLVLSYLLHHGYTDTAMSFARKTMAMDVNTEQDPTKREEAIVKMVDTKEAHQRCRMRDLILSGDYESALQLLRSAYPEVVARFPNVLFCLECGQFIEMIRCAVEQQDPNAECGNGSPVARMDIDGELRDGDATGMATSTNQQPTSIQEILEKGQRIHSKYSEIGNSSVRQALLELFSLVAYPNPYDSPVVHLLGATTRSRVADLANFAILGVQHKPVRPPLEVAVRQSAVVLDLLRHHEFGAADFVSLPLLD